MGRHAKKGCARTQRTEDGAMTDLRAKRSGGQILVVDDDKLIRGDITHMLQRILGGGAELLEAYDGRMAMQKLEASQAGIVLTDMRMPRMDGLALIEAARGRWPDLQFIVLSNYDDFDYVKQSFQHGIVDYTLKYQIDEPTLRELIERAREALEAYWREREYLEGMRKDTLYEESLRLGGEIAQCIESCTAPAFMERLRQPARIVRLDCLPREDAPGEWRRLAAAAFTGLFESDGRSELHPFVLPRKPGKEKLRMGVVACAQFVNPCALETTLRERVERFFHEPGGAACICAAALEPLESWDGALTVRWTRPSARSFTCGRAPGPGLLPKQEGCCRPASCTRRSPAPCWKDGGRTRFRSSGKPQRCCAKSAPIRTRRASCWAGSGGRCRRFCPLKKSRRPTSRCSGWTVTSGSCWRRSEACR